MEARSAAAAYKTEQTDERDDYDIEMGIGIVKDDVDTELMDLMRRDAQRIMEQEREATDYAHLQGAEASSGYIDGLVEMAARRGGRNDKVSLNKMIDMLTRIRGNPFSWSNRIVGKEIEQRTFSKSEGTWTMKVSITMEVYGDSVETPFTAVGVGTYTGPDEHKVLSMCLKVASTNAIRACLERANIL